LEEWEINEINTHGKRRSKLNYEILDNVYCVLLEFVGLGTFPHCLD
jgi:hypothetical protein